MDAYERANSIEERAMVRVREIYTAALRKALKEKQAFLQTVEAVQTGKKKPPAYYVNQGEEAVKRWKQGFVRELIRQEKVIEGIIAELNAAGVEAADVIRGSMADIYQTNREEIVQLLSAEAGQAGVNMTFAQYDKRQIDVILQENESPMSKIAYQNLGQNTAIRRKLQNELAQATILGEGQQQIIGRIRKVTDMTVSQARRVAQTERTRVQSQARWQAGEEVKAADVGVYNMWSTRMVRSRETHISLHGKKAMQGEAFVTSAGNSLLYPGDPSAPAREVINCHCVLVPGVLLPGERLDAEGNIVSADGLNTSEKDAIMYLQGRELMSIRQPIEQRNTAKGNPGAIITFGRPLNNRQRALLEELHYYNARAEVPKAAVNMRDLSALTAVTGCEFAMFTRNGKRLIVRGNEYQTYITEEMAHKMRNEGYRWSGHTHPGTDTLSLTPSDGDYAILRAFGQNRSVIYNSLGRMIIIEGGDSD